jgi:CheY-like chemotaxis protein
LERIFDPYFTTKGPGEGSGIGLAVVQGIIEGHGGAITVESKPEQGSVFRVFLPRVESPLLAHEEQIEHAMTGKERVLFVDDEPTLVNLGTEGLAAFGYRVTGKADAVEAWETFQASPELFDLIVTDMTMPGLTGVELARRTKGVRPELPVILCTGYSETVKGRLPEELGVDDIVMKPYQVSDITQKIRRLFTR